MDLTSSLQDDIYRATVLGPDRCGQRRMLSLLISGGLVLGLTGMGLWLGSQVEAPRALRTLSTVAVDLTEDLSVPLPPPPSPSQPAPSAPSTLAPAPSAIPETPRTLPAEPQPSSLPLAPQAATPGVPGGVPGGQAGGALGGQIGGQAGGEPGGIQPPQFSAAYLHNPEPDYPALSRRLGEEGRVILRVLVKGDGSPERLELRQSSGHARLDQAALDTVRRWKFSPARRGSEPLAAWVLVPLTFALDA